MGNISKVVDKNGNVANIGGGASVSSEERVIVHKAVKQTAKPGSKYYFNTHICYNVPNKPSGKMSTPLNGFSYYGILTIPENWSEYSKELYDGTISDKNFTAKLVQDGHLKLYQKGFSEGYLNFKTVSPNFIVRYGKVVCVASPDFVRNILEGKTDSRRARTSFYGQGDSESYINALVWRSKHFGAGTVSVFGFRCRSKYTNSSKIRCPRYHLKMDWRTYIGRIRFYQSVRRNRYLGENYMEIVLFAKNGKGLKLKIVK